MQHFILKSFIININPITFTILKSSYNFNKHYLNTNLFKTSFINKTQLQRAIKCPKIPKMISNFHKLKYFPKSSINQLNIHKFMLKVSKI